MTAAGLGIEMSLKNDSCPKLLTTLPVELPTPTNAQPVELNEILRVPNWHDSHLFFENTEQNGIEIVRKLPSIPMTKGAIGTRRIGRKPAWRGKSPKTERATENGRP